MDIVHQTYALSDLSAVAVQLAEQQITVTLSSAHISALRVQLFAHIISIAEFI